MPKIPIYERIVRVILFTILSDTTVVLQWIYKCHLFRLPLSGSYQKIEFSGPSGQQICENCGADKLLTSKMRNITMNSRTTFLLSVRALLFYYHYYYFFCIFVFLYFFFFWPFLKLLISQNVKWTLDIFSSILAEMNIPEAHVCCAF